MSDYTCPYSHVSSGAGITVGPCTTISTPAADCPLHGPAREYRLLRKMQAHGGEFTRHLATAWLAADPDNAGKLRASFGHMLARYEHAPDPDNCGVPRAFNGGDQT
mgnify:CR=1 FL=1